MRFKGLGSSVKWLYPGMRVKRWLMLVPVGLVFTIAGIVLITNIKLVDVLGYLANMAYRTFGLNLQDKTTLVVTSTILILLGLFIVFVSLRQVVRSITSVVSPEAHGKLADLVYKRRYLAQGYRFVVIGGGTGLSTLLRGLKINSSNIVAVVTVTDDGGSSGRLQREMGMLPPGDIRNCLVALAEEERMMTDLFQYRFDEQIQGLDGHSFGNLLIAVMTKITGDFELAVRETSKILAIRGLVLPSTLEDVRLQAEFADGSFAEGETTIVENPNAIKHIMLCPSNVKPLEETLRSIELADCIILGPGSTYTSVIPNLLVDGLAEAIEKSEAEKIYVCNVMTQPGETDGFTASDHVKAIERHTEHKVFDYVLLNDTRPNPELIQKYKEKGQDFVEPDTYIIREMGYRPIVGDFVSETEVVRHDPDKLAEAIYRLLY